MPARTQSRPAAGEGLVFIAEPEALAALREADGSEAWRLPLTEASRRPRLGQRLADRGDRLGDAPGASGGIDGHLIWRRDLGSPLSAPPALAADRVYAPARTAGLSRSASRPASRSGNAASAACRARSSRSTIGSMSDPTTISSIASRPERPNRLALAHWRRRRRHGRRGRAPCLFRVVRQHLARAGSPERGTAMETTVAVPASHRRADGRRGGDRERRCAAVARVSDEGRRARPARSPSRESSRRQPTSCAGPRLPLLVVVAREIVKGTTVTVFTRDFDPPHRADRAPAEYRADGAAPEPGRRRWRNPLEP